MFSVAEAKKQERKENKTMRKYFEVRLIFAIIWS